MLGKNDLSRTILKARIALLATAIGGPDHTSQLEPPPYKLGDDCLACLKDLRRWFRLVDENQNSWEVATASAEFNILRDDLIPILIDWDNKCSLANKFNSVSCSNKEHHDNIALLCVQLIVIMTNPQVLTDERTTRQVAVYSELKKHQLEYKRAILMTDKGRVLKAVVRLASKVMKIDRLRRTPRDNALLRMVVNLFRNVAAIEPGELNITKKKQISVRGINNVDTLPPGVSMDDVSLHTVIAAFHRNKVLKLVLTLASSMKIEFEQEFINIPLMELMFYLTKGTHPQACILNKRRGSSNDSNDKLSFTGAQLLELLNRENSLKKNLIKNTSTRHSRFGALLSIQTPENGRLTVSAGGQNLLDDNAALSRLDSRKRWNKRSPQNRDDMVNEGLPNSLLNLGNKSELSFDSTMDNFVHFIDDFIESSFNTVLYSITNQYTGYQDQISTLEQTEYLLFFAWFVKYQREKYNKNLDPNISCVDSALQETPVILVCTLLRNGYESKNWAIIHAGMIAFNEILLLIGCIDDPYNKDELDRIISKLFSDDRIQLLSTLPKTAFKYSLQYMKSCIELVNTVLITLEKYGGNSSLIVTKKIKSTKGKAVTEEEVTSLMDSHGIGRDEALDALNPSYKTMEFNFMRVLKKFCVEPVIDTYITYLERFRELEDTEIKRAIHFLHRVFVQASEHSILFRLDLILLLKDMLSPDGISMKSRVRTHVEQFSNYFLYKLKKTLKSSPSWYVGLLFPLLYGSEVDYYQKYGRLEPHKEKNYYAVSPSRFKRIEDEEKLPTSVLKDIKYGILVSTLLDDGKEEFLIDLVSHMRTALDRFESWLALDFERKKETVIPPAETLHIKDSNESKPLIFDKDLRALLSLIGYCLPLNVTEQCNLPCPVELGSLRDSLELVKKHMAVPFQTPNGLSSSSYLLRSNFNEPGSDVVEDKWNSYDEYAYREQPEIIPEDEQLFVTDDNSYFKELEKDTGNKLPNKNIGRGIARTKKMSNNKRKQRNISSLPLHDIDEEVERNKKRKYVLSKDFISDSEEEDGDVNPLFFENEMYMRWLLDKHKGQLPETLYALFGKFSSERIVNNGSLKNDYSVLFGDSVPDPIVLRNSDIINDPPDRTLISLSKELGTRFEQTSGEVNHQDTDSKFSDRDGLIGGPTSKQPPIRHTALEGDGEYEERQISMKRRRIFLSSDEDD